MAPQQTNPTPPTIEQVENSSLLSAMEQAKKDNSPQSVRELLRALFQSVLITPVAVAEQGNGAPPQIGFPLLRSPNGVAALPVFTDRDSYARFSREGQSCTVLRFGQVLAALFRSRAEFLVINAGSEAPLELSRNQLRSVMEQLQRTRPAAQP